MEAQINCTAWLCAAKSASGKQWTADGGYLVLPPILLELPLNTGHILQIAPLTPDSFPVTFLAMLAAMDGNVCQAVGWQLTEYISQILDVLP